MYVIYFLQDPRNKKKGYIGKTCNLKERLAGHFNPTALKPNTIRNNWMKKLLKLGRKPSVKILKEVSSNKDANKFEKLYIKKFKKLGYILVNGTPGGDGWTKGHKMPKTKKRIEASRRMQKSVILRDKLTGEDVIIDSVKGAAKFARIDVSHAQLALHNKDRVLSAGGYHWRYFGEKFIPPRKKKRVKRVLAINLTTKEERIYEPAYNCRLDGFNPRCVQAICTGYKNQMRKQHKGWTFKYV